MKTVCAWKTYFQANNLFYSFLYLLKTLFSLTTQHSGRKSHFSKVLMWISRRNHCEKKKQFVFGSNTLTSGHTRRIYVAIMNKLFLLRIYEEKSFQILWIYFYKILCKFSVFVPRKMRINKFSINLCTE